MRIRTNGDLIAQEFAKLMGSNGIAKTASISKKAEESVSGGDTTVSIDNIKDDSVSDEDLADLVSTSTQVDDDSLINQIDESLDDISDSEEKTEDLAEEMKQAKNNNKFISKKGMNVMYGLGKIAASLRSKGEGFAADVVEATALSISEDLKKEAAEKKSVISHLEKVAGKLDRKGDKFAGDLVRATMKNIVEK
jgi:hypothetical protein